ncbi:MAG: urate oxidase [Verrucomicrobia bacterium]|nr:urate oxidase [Verrucomicrobiota bacterium]
MNLKYHRYGKAKVRVLKKLKRDSLHTIKELDVQVLLAGDFESSYSAGDNRSVVATDTMKNTVNVLAFEKLEEQTEVFALELAQHFLEKYPQVSEVAIETSERVWQRLKVDGQPSPTNFLAPQKYTPVCEVHATRANKRLASGVRDLVILKSAGSAFTDFHRDEFTTLPETQDRILATSMTGKWTFAATPADYNKTNEEILEAMLECFVSNDSPSVQKTMYDMGLAALNRCPEISEVNLVMPNLHCLLVDLKPFGQMNPNTLFVPTDTPHGLIEATIERGK